MIFVKEKNDAGTTVEEKAKTDLKEMAKMFGKNKYWSIYCIIGLIGSIVGNMGVGVYYFDKIIGDVGIQSAFAGVSALAVVALFVLPPLMKKVHLSKILLYGQLISAGLATISFIFYNNIPILVICYVLSMFATLPGVYAGRIIMCDAALYNEFVGLNRMEGTMSSVLGFMKRAGGALGTFLLGVGLKAIKYDAAATPETLSTLTFWGLRIMMYGLPLLSAAVQALLWSFYKLDDMMPEIKAELERRGETDVKDGEELAEEIIGK